MFKLPYNCIHFTCQQGNVQNSSSQALAVCELRTSRYSSWIQKRQKYQRSNCQHSWDHKAKEFQKKIYFCFIDYAKAFDCVDYNKLGEILQEMGIPDHSTCLLKNLYAGQKATFGTIHGTTGSKLGKQYIKAVYCHTVYLTYMQSTSCETPDWMKHKLESRFPRKISTTSDMQMIPV